jgi:hypothetical protein
MDEFQALEAECFSSRITSIKGATSNKGAPSSAVFEE